MNIIPSIIYPINTILIKNRYEIIGGSDRYSLVIFYIDQNTCNVLARKLIGIDTNIDIYIVIYDINEKYSETLKLDKTEKKYVLPSIKLYKDEIIQNQIIPKVIMQTHETNIYINDFHKNSIETWTNLNPEYTYVYYNSVERRKFIKENYNETILLAYDTLIRARHKIDLFKYCWLYTNGGCYTSYRTYILKSLRTIINPQDTYILCSSMRGINDDFIIINKGDEKLNEVIQYMTWLVNERLTKYKINMFYSLKSSYILSKFFKQYNLRLKTNDNKIILSDKVLVLKYQLNYTSPYQKIYNYFSKLKDNHLRVLKNREQIGNYIFYVYKNSSIAYFNFNIIDSEDSKEKKLQIINIKQQGWNVDLKIKIIDNILNTEHIIPVGKSQLYVITIPIII